MPLLPEANMLAFMRDSAATIMEAGEDPVPVLFVERADGTSDFAMLAVDGHPVDAIAGATPAIVANGPIARASLLVDSYMYTGSFEAGHPGDLAVLFAQGHPDVSEALSIATAWADGATTMTRYPYTRTDNGIEWGEALTYDGGSMTGRVPDALEALIRASL